MATTPLSSQILFYYPQSFSQQSQLQIELSRSPSHPFPFPPPLSAVFHVRKRNFFFLIESMLQGQLTYNCHLLDFVHIFTQELK